VDEAGGQWAKSVGVRPARKRVVGFLVSRWMRGDRARSEFSNEGEKRRS